MHKEIHLLFEKAFNQLNTEQQQAVSSIEGPLLVVAGPGTGKTQILAARIAYILKNTDTAPENILCLTYTDAGTVAMRNRLLQFIGPDAYRVDVFTFHAFCNMVIQENLDFFGVRALTAISDLERIQLVHQIIDNFPKGHLLKRYAGDIYYETKKLLNLYDNMKREGWTPELIRQCADSYINDLPNRDGFIYKKNSKDGKKGELRKKLADEEKRKMDILVAAALTFDDYNRLMQQKNYYDFSDMISWVINAFSGSSDMLLRYQERYLYYLVDEFQDTSGSQNQLLDLLLSYWNSPNIFCVGDDDQSIFRFQGANVENIHHFITKYSPNKITLTSNYRSSQHILDTANGLIKLNQIRIEPDKQLLAQNTRFAGSAVYPQIRSYYNQSHETAAIANEIIGLKNQGVALNEIAVLYRNHKQAEEMLQYFQEKKIPFHIKRKANVLEEIFVKKLVLVLKYLSAESVKAHSGEIYIYEMLHFDFFALSPLDIAKISIEVYKENFNERATSWREQLAKTDKQAELFSTQKQNLKKASDLLEGWIKNQANITLQQFLEKVITQSGMLVSALSSADRVWQMQLLQTFFDFVKQECERNPQLKLKQLIETIELMEKEGVSLPAQQVSYAPDGVQFITAHSSKGLEFEYVYLIGCNKTNWDDSKKRHQFTLPDTLFSIHSEDSSEENRRLFYVALTRAKQFLTISFLQHDNNGKELEKSRHVAELENETEIKAIASFATDEQLVDLKLNVFKSANVVPASNPFDHALVDQILEKYSLSVTHLNNYLRCPTTFYFNNLIRVPAPMSASMTFGSAIHYALERLFKNMNNNAQKQFAPVEEVIKDFGWYMRRNREAFTDSEFKRRIEYAEEFLPKYYSQYIHDWNKVTSIERSYRNVVVDGVPISGKLDKLEFDGNHVNVVDYKTGQYKNATNKFNRPDKEKVEEAKEKGKPISFEDEYGGDYWRQAVFYKLLLEYDKGKNWEMKSAEFDFVEPDKTSGDFLKQRVAITHEDMIVVKNQILDSYKRIMNKEFEVGCMEDDCRWCNFMVGYASAQNTNPDIAKETDETANA